MKPIRLEMRGINSFKETQTVDFSKLTKRGIFGIFGPTGSGKSTILDAMTLALYDRTARNSREYINSDSDEMFVSLEFEVGTEFGRTAYVVERGKKRGKDGKIKGTIDRLYRKDGLGEIHEKNGKVNQAVVNLLGLTMDDFTRSVVLPQGKFSDFLTLTGVNRKKMLERILKLQEFGEMLTGRVKTEKEKNEKLLYGVKESLEAYSNLEIERLEEFKENIEICNKETKKLLDAENEIHLKLELAIEFWAKKDRLSSICRELEILKTEEQEMGSLLKRFETARKVKEMVPHLKEKKRAQEEIVEKEKALEHLQEKRENLGGVFESAERALKEAGEKKRRNYEPLMRKKLALEHFIEEDAGKLNDLEEKNRIDGDACESGFAQIKAMEIAAAKMTEHLDTLKSSLAGKKDEFDAIAREHLIASVGKDLAIGDACPVCGNEIRDMGFVDNVSGGAAVESMESMERDLAGISDAIAKVEKELNEIKEKSIRLSSDVGNLKKRLETNREEEKSLKAKMRELFGLEKPENILVEVNGELEILDDAEKTASLRNEELRKEIQEADRELYESGRMLEKLKERFRMASKALKTGMDRSGIDAEDDILGFMFGDAELESMENSFKAWSMKRSKLNIQKEDVQAELDKFDINDNRAEMDVLKTEFDKTRIEREGKNERAIRLKERVEQMEKNIETVKGLEERRLNMEKKDDLLKEIMDLLRGNAFVGFVAMRHLRYIVRDASVRLLDITGGRYRLEIGSDGEFVICDHYSGGVRRKCDTLSGGETFIVSLALALALSAKIQMNQANDLEFFFLDEGFGTLDTEVLDIVMDSLEKIREKDLSVGLISHVEALKDRVPIKLVVEPAEPGISGSALKMEYL